MKYHLDDETEELKSVNCTNLRAKMKVVDAELDTKVLDLSGKVKLVK